MKTRKIHLVNGVGIYLIGVLFLILKHRIYPHAYADIYDSFGLLLINPLMIYIYDYLIDSSILKKSSYFALIIFSYFVELFTWDYFRQLIGEVSFIQTFVGKVILIALLIQFVLAIICIKYHLKKRLAIFLLSLIPLMTYFILAFASSFASFT